MLVSSRLTGGIADRTDVSAILEDIIEPRISRIDQMVTPAQASYVVKLGVQNPVRETSKIIGTATTSSSQPTESA